jgi:hypothetical protein
MTQARDGVDAARCQALCSILCHTVQDWTRCGAASRYSVADGLRDPTNVKQSAAHIRRAHTHLHAFHGGSKASSALDLTYNFVTFISRDILLFLLTALPEPEGAYPITADVDRRSRSTFTEEINRYP